MNKKKKKMIDYGRYGYFFIAPFFITYLVFQLWPLINTFYYSTLSYYKRNGREFMEFAGLQNFVNILGMAAGERGYVLSYLKNTLVMWGCNFVPQILVSLLLAVWLTDEKVKVKGTGAMKVIVYLPSVITAASVSVLFKSLFSQYGPITQTLKDWGVLGIDPGLFKAADIDGATGWKKFRYITLPLLKPIMLYTLVTSAIGGLQMYDIPALFNVPETGLVGLPDDKTTTMAMYIMRLYSSDVGKAAAVSVVLFIITLVVSLILFATMSDSEDRRMKKEQKQRRKAGGRS